ncbi:hypothetical protein A2X44_02565 [candidate division CPR3 bacterium GWF2_35_18]|uniref:Glycosyl transferase, family 39 n=1 Tax=candidate division CPR3 bacterium GW2011_GWF2_35_18 TaxID=1618350 RepID=A0A0G0EPN7_UNCC3|nr:MAG: Glycosyl transferase, family 39 [candidate division CPR3 bacterium GW2011_GWF2_35_18]KKP85577.1 MAG: Glycosyl transferase, family 39 [candidate division CPR3 bacterium GW2011_GWE2_35_7]OGB62475.1 MAG: hypothetical protein A2X44_02565 [candidate division CPR3 bacterium GWF2_35_18]OGB65519.1 MAG: hypothetical protein A2250_04145 [candidate division CPR3 bacterium RIFOXYA2_FULL_35_13]OGB75783.1 MAG: hypothetical protein A2476_01525 [candidate division CPR3 bacterium RIFOXYC2_FULL_35_7]OGB
MSLLEKFLFILLIILSLLFCFYKLGSPEIQRWDEGTNIKVVTESLNLENPLILKYEGKFFFEKPPLFYYLTMASVQILGANNFGFRFISALSGFLIILLVFLIGKSLYSTKAGLISGFFLLTVTQLFISNPAGIFATHNFRSADSDSLQILFMLVAFYDFYQFYKQRKTLPYFGIIASSLAILIKGPLGLIPFISLILLLIINKEKPFPKKESLIILVLIALAIIPWHFMMYVKFDSQFINEYLHYHLFARGLTPLEGHGEPFWFYFQIMFSPYFFSTAILFFVSLIFLFMEKNLLQEKSMQFLLLIICLFFSIITLTQTKLSWYLLPLYPFIAILSGGVLEKVAKKHQKILWTLIPIMIISTCLNIYFLTQI